MENYQRLLQEQFAIVHGDSIGKKCWDSMGKTWELNGIDISHFLW